MPSAETMRAQARCTAWMPSHPAKLLDTQKTQLTLLERARVEVLVIVLSSAHGRAHLFLSRAIKKSWLNCTLDIARRKLPLDSKNVSLKTTTKKRSM